MSPKAFQDEQHPQLLHHASACLTAATIIPLNQAKEGVFQLSRYIQKIISTSVPSAHGVFKYPGSVTQEEVVICVPHCVAISRHTPIQIAAMAALLLPKKIKTLCTKHSELTSAQVPRG